MFSEQDQPTKTRNIHVSLQVITAKSVQVYIKSCGFFVVDLPAIHGRLTLTFFAMPLKSLKESV